MDEIDYTKIFNTVPLSMKILTRDANGSKVDQDNQPIKFKGDWKQYIVKKNIDNTPVLGAIALDTFIGIDIDNNPLMDELYPLVDDICTYVAISLPTDANKGGHLLFRYNEEHAKALRLITKALKKTKIDIQVGNKLIFLATPANKTKTLVTEPIQNIEDLVEIPDALLAKLVLIALPHLQDTLINSSSIKDYPDTMFGFMLQHKLNPFIVAELTPKQDYPNIKDMDDIPKGHATQWMLQVRKKLQVDKSVSPDIFTKTLVYLNSLWHHPRGPSAQLQLDINRDLKDLAWVYDSKWQVTGLIYPNKLGHAIEVYYDDEEGVFITHNKHMETLVIHHTQTKLVNSIVSTHIKRKKFTGEQILKQVQTIRLKNTPELPPLVTDNYPDYPNLNMFIQTEGSKILNGVVKPQSIKHPSTILKFLENLMPDKGNRERFMQFIAHKHKTYEHSPLYFVLAGVGGAGKGVLVNEILRYLSGNDRLQQANLEAITNNFNVWMERTDWLEIEEAGEGYSNKENEKLVGTLKKITGNAYLTVERKGVDRGVSPKHYITPIISTNMQTKLITDTVANDRRLVLFKCPNKLSLITDDTREFIAKMRDELPSFAYYLKSLDTIDYKDYHDNTNWKTTDYHDYIYDTTSATDKLFEAAEHQSLDKFIEELSELNIKYSDIDSMFSQSIEGMARCFIYHTNATLGFGFSSLLDVATNHPLLDTNIKQRFKPLKKTRNFDKGRYRLNCLEFPQNYINLSNICEIKSELIEL